MLLLEQAMCLPTNKSGGQLSLSKNAEIELAEILKLKAKWGYAHTVGN